MAVTSSGSARCGRCASVVLQVRGSWKVAHGRLSCVVGIVESVANVKGNNVQVTSVRLRHIACGSQNTHDCSQFMENSPVGGGQV